MSIDYSILEEFNINKELAIKYINDSTQVRKYVEAICDTSIINSIKKKKAKGLKELLRNLKEWYCEPCDIQLYSALNYKKHLTGVEHRAKVNGNDAIICSSASCRKKFATLAELEEHLHYSPKCIIVSPKNKAINELGRQQARWDKEKELYKLFRYEKDSMTDAQKEEYNKMILDGISGRDDIISSIGSDGFIITNKKKQLNHDEEEKKAIEKYEKMHRESAHYRREFAMDIYNMRIQESSLESDKFLGGYSSEDYNDDGFKDMETEIKKI